MATGSRVRARHRQAGGLFSAAPRVIVILVCSVGLAFPAFADIDETEEQIFEQARVGRRLWAGFRDRISGVRIGLTQESYFGAQFDDTNLDWSRTGLSIAGALPLPARRQGVAVSFSTAVVNPIVNGSNNFLDLGSSRDDPLDPLLDSAFRLGGQFEVGHGFGVELTANLSARHEIGADLKSALAAGGSFALGYRRGDWLRLRLGVGLGSAIDNAKLTASPVFRLRVRAAPRLWLETDGTSGRIEWAISSRHELSLFGGIDSKRYRLSSRGGPVGRGSLELRKSEVGVGIRSDFWRRIRVGVEAAVVLGQHLTVLDDDRQTVDARDTREPSGALRFSLEWRGDRRPDKNTERNSDLTPLARFAPPLGGQRQIGR